MATRDEDFLSQVFVVNTHTPVLFFSSRGMVYKLKVYRLPLGTPQARGKPMVKLLPLGEGETISTVMPLPQDEAKWANLQIMFATSTGNVRRNALSDFANIKANGKIAMKLEEGERLIAVRPCSDAEDVLLATRNGKCIRFTVGDVRVFSGRTSTGVRGVKLADGDEVISMSMLRHASSTSPSATPICACRKRRRGGDIEAPEAAANGNGETPEPAVPAVTLSEERLRGLRGAGGVHPVGHGARLRQAHARPTSTASPIAAGRASPISRRRSATARWSPRSRCGTRTRSCWSPTAASSSARRSTTSASPGGRRRASPCSGSRRGKA